MKQLETGRKNPVKPRILQEIRFVQIYAPLQFQFVLMKQMSPQFLVDAIHWDSGRFSVANRI
jgi:hypothetical protein